MYRYLLFIAICPC